MGGIGYWDGDDYVSHYFGDRSVLVQAATGLGAVADLQGLVVPAFAAGVTLPALGQARQRANELKSATQLRSVQQAMMIYASTNDDQPPQSLEDLIEAGYIIEEMFESPMGSAWDNGPDYTFRLTEDAVASFNASYISGIDRAAVVNGEWEVNVVFADGHVERVDLIRLEELLNKEWNKGAIEDLQIEGF